MGSPEPPADERGPPGRWKLATRTLISERVLKVLVAMGQIAALAGLILRSCS